MSVFSSRKVAAAVRTREDFEIALKSRVDVIFLLYSSIMNIKGYIDKCHKAGKKIFIHMDLDVYKRQQVYRLWQSHSGAEEDVRESSQKKGKDGRNDRRRRK